MKAQTERWYKISIHSQKIGDDTPKGYGYTFGGPGWGGTEIERPEWQRDLRYTIVVVNGEAFAALDIWKYLLDTTSLQWDYLKFGSRKMVKVSDYNLEQAVEFQSYPDRNRNEALCTKRNSSLIDWLMTLSS